MKYENIVKGKFIERPNRFVAFVEIGGKRTMVHVKNTGRCKELLVPGAEVYLQHAPSSKRKTDYSMISVKKGELFINIDSQAPNHVVYEAILSEKIHMFKKPDLLKKEVAYGTSRFDLYFESYPHKGFIEVKGVTLEENGTAMFPDAPTNRGTRHVLEIMDAVKAGYQGFIIFLIQMKGVHSFIPNNITDPAFSEALKQASENNVKILSYDCNVSEDSIEISESVSISF